MANRSHDSDHAFLTKCFFIHEKELIKLTLCIAEIADINVDNYEADKCNIQRVETSSRRMEEAA